MSVAKQKRQKIVELAVAYELQLVETVVNSKGLNKGPKLTPYFQNRLKSIWRDGLPWCAAMITFLVKEVDELISSAPKSKFYSLSSQAIGAGIFSYNERDAVPGLAIIYQNVNNKSIGHIALVVGVDLKKNEITTFDGNTSAPGGKHENVVTRDGIIFARKTRKINSLRNPKSVNVFYAYAKLWDEKNEDLKKEVGHNDPPKPQAVEHSPPVIDEPLKRDEIRKNIQSNVELPSNLGRLTIIREETDLKSSISHKQTTNNGKIPIDRQQL